MSWFIGQFHPLLVHLPIGMWVLAFLFKWLTFKNPSSAFSKALPFILLAIFISSFFTSLSGYLLSLSGAYEEELADKHKWAGIVLTILSGALFWLTKTNKSARFQHILWVTSAIFLFITGHLGGSLTHGEDYLSFSNPTYEKPIIEDVQEAMVYKDIIEPIFAEKCWACHSAKKQKGELRLDGEKWVLEGGENGDVLIPHRSKESDLYQRLILEEIDDDHMPPSRKPQLTEEEVKLIAWWIDGGMDFTKKTKNLEQNAEIQSILNQLEQTETSAKKVDLPINEIERASQEAIQTLRNARLSVVPVAQNSNYLSVNLLGKTLADSVWKALEKIAPNVAYLNAKGCQLAYDQWATFKAFENLRKLDLSESNVNDSSINFILPLTGLNSLNLTQTSITENGIEKLIPLQKLRNLYLFETKIDLKNWNKLQTLFPETVLDSGNYQVPVLGSDTTIFTKEALAKSKE